MNYYYLSCVVFNLRDLLSSNALYSGKLWQIKRFYCWNDEEQPLPRKCQCFILLWQYTNTASFPFLKNIQKPKLLILKASYFILYGGNNNIKSLCFTTWSDTLRQFTYAYKSVFVFSWAATHHDACLSTAWGLLFYEQTAIKSASQVTSQRESVAKSCTGRSGFISLECEHVSCKEACLFWKRKSRLPDWCNTPAETHHRHTNDFMKKMFHNTPNLKLL